MKKITANGQLLKKLRIGHFSDIGIPIVLFITSCVVIHGLLQGRCNANVVNNQAAFFILKDTIDASNGLHQVIALHRFINIHCCKRRNIKSGQPHINDYGNLHFAIIVFEFLGELIPAAFVSNNSTPLFRIFIALGHYDLNLFFPAWAQFKNTIINLHSDYTGIRDNHCFSCQEISSVIFIMIKNIINQRIYSSVISKDSLHLSKLLFALFHYFKISVIRHDVVFLID